MWIQFRNSITVKGGDIQVRFRDVDHLNKISIEFPLIEARKIFYVLDPNIEDGKEFVPVKGQLVKEKFINIISDKPLKLEGSIPLLKYSLALPKKSNWNDLNFTGKTLSTYLSGYEQAQNLIEVMKHFNVNLFQIRTSDAKKILKNREKDRADNPTRYPTLTELCPSLFLTSNSSIQINTIDSIVSSSPLIYISDTVNNVKKIRKDYQNIILTLR